MINSGECPKCGCDKIAGPHKVYGQAHIRIDLPGVSTATLESLTCTECGYTEFYSDQLGLKKIRKYGRFLQNAPSEKQRVCAFCGTKVLVDAVYCPECGNNF